MNILTQTGSAIIFTATILLLALCWLSKHSKPPGPGIWLAGLLFLPTGAVLADQCTLTWQGSPVQTFGGYMVYWGPTSHPATYPNSLDVGLVTSATITNLSAGSTNYFVVTAYDTNHVLYSPIPRKFLSQRFRLAIVVQFQLCIANSIEGPWTSPRIFGSLIWSGITTE